MLCRGVFAAGCFLAAAPALAGAVDPSNSTSTTKASSSTTTTVTVTTNPTPTKFCEFETLPTTPFAWDPVCVQEGVDHLGCIADGKNHECRFCGKAPYGPCPTCTFESEPTTPHAWDNNCKPGEYSKGCFADGVHFECRWCGDEDSEYDACPTTTTTTTTEKTTTATATSTSTATRANDIEATVTATTSSSAFLSTEKGSAGPRCSPGHAGALIIISMLFVTRW
eukprot:CAMPEP_0203858448 /NCGR_PEP_ID=MMETSP0359-20131031/11281_1 /ASSEMBLY_ACC=CAM_ASM_000338 /TAXON_ID=268821 /ORGANISM="Scrippsiella Hangoei, Strain SHTV-5" /LENGTH=223 /DNA_ID=CAMNT_0050775225 /DNA_START=50 /DNA_END=718 /DNA_ORIENTATION=+